mmetsp:Transcript_16615/g.51982  ORF Transcript_16615/g.51982 Transcript_16615/m.51982 type:complete len:238 (-) Transcript_16615:1381-2094(-)
MTRFETTVSARPPTPSLVFCVKPRRSPAAASKTPMPRCVVPFSAVEYCARSSGNTPARKGSQEGPSLSKVSKAHEKETTQSTSVTIVRLDSAFSLSSPPTSVTAPPSTTTVPSTSQCSIAKRPRKPMTLFSTEVGAMVSEGGKLGAGVADGAAVGAELGSTLVVGGSEGSEVGDGETRTSSRPSILSVTVAPTPMAFFASHGVPRLSIDGPSLPAEKRTTKSWFSYRNSSVSAESES